MADSPLLVLRVPDNLNRVLKSQAARQGMSLSEYVRGLILRGLEAQAREGK